MRGYHGIWRRRSRYKRAGQYIRFNSKLKTDEILYEEEEKLLGTFIKILA